VPVYWIVDPDERRVEVWTPRDTFPVFEHRRLVWHPIGAANPLEIDLGELFKPL
jgi:Uma2 family endonuclease